LTGCKLPERSTESAAGSSIMRSIGAACESTFSDAKVLTSRFIIDIHIVNQILNAVRIVQKRYLHVKLNKK